MTRVHVSNQIGLYDAVREFAASRGWRPVRHPGTGGALHFRLDGATTTYVVRMSADKRRWEIHELEESTC